MTAAQYRAHLQALLPQGAAWPRDADATLTHLVGAMAEEFARLDARTDELLNEADPRTTNELLTDWERVAGLPEPCLINVPQNPAERRQALVAKLTTSGGQSRQFFIDLAASIGYVITIDEFDPHDVEDDVEYPIIGELWRFAWQVNAAQFGAIGELTVEDTVEDPLRWWGNEELECVLGDRKPAHTHVIFAYT